VGLNSLKSLNLTNGYPNKNKNKNKNKNNKVKSKPLELRSRVIKALKIVFSVICCFTHSFGLFDVTVIQPSVNVCL
jgi:hypothetical protein